MTKIRQEVVNKIWGGEEPFAGRSIAPELVDYQGWASDNPVLRQSIERVKPRIIVEVGVWKGSSVINMADYLRHVGLDGVVIAVDTWLGAAEHWLNPQYRTSLKLTGGYPSLFNTFSANIASRHLEEYVVPLALDSLNAAQVIKHYNLMPEILHIDGGHDYESVIADLRAWWPTLATGGILIGDDYHPTGIEVWPEVRAAFHDFFKTTRIDNFGGKCAISKNPSSKPIFDILGL